MVNSIYFIRECLDIRKIRHLLSIFLCIIQLLELKLNLATNDNKVETINKKLDIRIN